MSEPLDLKIRPIELRDAAAMHAMRIMPGVQETISGIYTERITSAEDFIRNLTPNDFQLVAEVMTDGEWKLVGSVGLSIDPKPRRRHVALMGIMVRTEWQGRGIGRRLLERILDLADNWLMLARVELTVFAANERAVALYKSFGFEIEGRLKSAMVLDGKYADELIMGRIV